MVHVVRQTDVIHCNQEKRTIIVCGCRSQWPCGLRRESAVTRLLGLWILIPSAAWMSVCCECCVLSGRGVCVGLITRPEESYRVSCVWGSSWSLDTENALAHYSMLRCVKKYVGKMQSYCQGRWYISVYLLLCLYAWHDPRNKQGFFFFFA